MARRLSAQRPPSARLVAENLGTDLQTPPRGGPRTFYASTQTPPNAPSSEEFRLKSKKVRKARWLGAFGRGRGRCKPPDPSGQPGHTRAADGAVHKKGPIFRLWRVIPRCSRGRQFPNRT